MPEQLWVTAFLNKYLAGVANAILGVFHLHSKYPQAPITNYVAMQLVVFVLLIVVFALVRSRLSVENPGNLQHVFESIDSMISQQGLEVIGHGYERYTNYLITLGIFILTCNLIGLIPGFEAPTAVPSVPLGCAVVTWIYYQMHGIRTNGPGYIKHFLGPVWWLAPLDVRYRSRKSPGTNSVAHRPSFCQHVCRRHGDAGVLFAVPNRDPRSVHVAARRRLVYPDLYFRAAGNGVYRRSGGARALKSLLQA